VAFHISSEPPQGRDAVARVDTHPGLLCCELERSGRMAVPHKSIPTEEAWRNFYTQQHKHYCGIDLHARAMYVCILDQHGTKLVHKNLPTTPEALLRVIAPYREDLVVGVECMFTWYWLADLCQKEGIAFVLGHALYMKAIHGGKAKNDKIDAHKIAVL